MLVLSRKPGESLTIGGTVVVKVISVSGRTVKLGIEAPQAVAVLREEAVARAPRPAQADAAAG